MKVMKFLPKRIQKALKKRLEPKEQVMVALPALSVFRSKGRWSWPAYIGLFHPPVLLMTNKRFVLVGKSFFRTMFYAWEHSAIDRANFEAGRFGDQITLVSGEDQTHILCSKKVRKASKQFTQQIWQMIGARKSKKRRRSAS